MHDLIIINAGKFGREVYCWACQAISQGAPWQFKGFLDNRADALQGLNYPAEIIGTVENYQPTAADVFLCAIGDPAVKRRFCSLILQKGGRFTNLIHPWTCVGRNVQLGTGVILAPFSSLTCDCKVGNFVSLGAFSGGGHDCFIGDWCQISGHCGINGNAILEEGVFLGSHVAILPKARVGAWAYIGAGSVVLRRINPRVKAFGNPAVQIGMMAEP